MSTVSVIYDLIGRDRASAAFDSAGRSAARLERTMGGVSRTVTVAGAAIAGAAVAIGAESVRAAVSFQASMEKIHTQAGASQSAVDSLTKSVLKLAPSAQQGPEQLAGALYHLKSVGMDNADAMKALKTASDLAAVGGADLESTTNALAGAWRSGIKGATGFGGAAATVNAIIGAGNMQMQDFVDAIGTGILPSAKTFGVSLQSVGAALALMTDEGVPAVDAATRLRMSLSLLGAPSAAADKALKTIRLSGYQLGQAMRGPQGIIGAVKLLSQHLKTSGLDATQQAQLISEAFGGGRSSSAIMTMLNNLSVLEKKQKQINDTTGKYGGAVKAQRKTASAQFALLRSSVDTVGTRLGLDLLPPVTAFVSWLAKTGVPGVEKFTGKVVKMLPVKQVKDDAGKIIGAIGNLFGIGKPAVIPYTVKMTKRNVGQLHAAHQEIGSATGGQLAGLLSGAFGKVNWGNVLATVIKGAVSGAQKIGAAFLELLGKVDWTSLGGTMATALVGLAVGIVNNLIPALIGEAVHHPVDMVMFVTSLIPLGRVAGILVKILDKVPLLGPLAKFLLGPVEKAGHIVESAFGKILKKIFGPAAGRIGGFFKGARKWLAGKGEDILLGLWYGAERIWTVIARWLGKITDFTLAPFKTAGKWLLSKGGDVISGLFDGLRAGWRGVTGWLGKIYGWVMGYWIKANVWLLRKGYDLLAGLLRGAAAGWRPVGEWLAKAGSRITGYWVKANVWLFDTGVHLISGLKNGIVSAFRGIGSWVKNTIVDPLIGWVKSWFGIHSPSTVMAWIGSHLMGGLFKGMMSHDLGAMVKKIFGSLPGALGAIVGKGLAAVTELPGKALSALGSLGSKGLSLLGKGASWLGHLFGIGGGGSSPAEQLGQAMAASMGWTGPQWQALDMLWNRESGWQVNAVNPASGAYGIPQALPASKMASAGTDWLTNPATQVRWGLGYILGRYGSPLNAWAHESARGWYGHGGTFRAGQLVGVGDRGPELISFDQGGRVFSPEQSAALIAAANKGSDGGSTRGPLVHVGEMNVREESDVAMVAQRLSGMIRAAGLGGGFRH